MKQADPLFFDKLLPLCFFLREQVLSTQISPSQRYLYARELSFFCLEVFAGDRASDLGRVFTGEVMNLPEGAVFYFVTLLVKRSGERLYRIYD